MFRDISREAAVAKSNAGLRTRSFIYAANNQLVNFQAPNSTSTSSAFGTIRSAFPARVIQMALKFVF